MLVVVDQDKVSRTPPALLAPCISATEAQKLFLNDRHVTQHVLTVVKPAVESDLRRSNRYRFCCPPSSHATSPSGVPSGCLYSQISFPSDYNSRIGDVWTKRLGNVIYGTQGSIKSIYYSWDLFHRKFPLFKSIIRIFLFPFFVVLFSFWFVILLIY